MKFSILSVCQNYEFAVETDLVTYDFFGFILLLLSFTLKIDGLERELTGRFFFILNFDQFLAEN